MLRKLLFQNNASWGDFFLNKPDFEWTVKNCLFLRDCMFFIYWPHLISDGLPIELFNSFREVGGQFGQHVVFVWGRFNSLNLKFSWMRCNSSNRALLVVPLFQSNTTKFYTISHRLDFGHRFHISGTDIFLSSSFIYGIIWF